MADFDEVMQEHNRLVGDFHRLKSEFHEKLVEFRDSGNEARNALHEAKKNTRTLRRLNEQATLRFISCVPQDEKVAIGEIYKLCHDKDEDVSKSI